MGGAVLGVGLVVVAAGARLSVGELVAGLRVTRLAHFLEGLEVSVSVQQILRDRVLGRLG